jgi:hypothetical protein
MNNKEELNKLFSNILGTKIELTGEDKTINETVFESMIKQWETAWSIQNELLSKFGVFFEGYDSHLYNALNDAAELIYGKAKAEIIQWYIYDSKKEDGTRYVLTDPETLKEYTLNTPKDLYLFLKNIDSTSFEINDGEEVDDDEDDEE